MDINSLKDNLSKSLADVSTKGIPSANFEPVWINNITRLNAQNFNARMYPTIASYITGYGDAVFKGSNEQLFNLLTILPGYKVSDSIPTEIHNIEADLSSTNKASGNYQAVFGIGNTTGSTIGQFITGQYNRISDDFIFAIGNGSSDTERSNALEVSADGELKTSSVSVINGITAPYVKITTAISDTSDNTYAATKKYVFDKVKTETDRATAAEQLLTTNLNNEISRAKSEEDTIRAIASSAFHFKGSKPSYDDLPKTDNTIGDVWQVDDKEYAWNGTEWVELGFNIDISGKQDRFAEYIVSGDTGTLTSDTQELKIVKGSNSFDIRTNAADIGNMILSSDVVAISANFISTISVPDKDLMLHLGLGNNSDDMAMSGPAGEVTIGTYNTSTNIDGLNLMGKDTSSSVKNYININSKNIHLFNYDNTLRSYTPLLGISTPVVNADSTLGIKTEDIPYQAVNKDYVDTNFQAKLVSGTNIKSIKDDTTTTPQSLLGSGSLSFKTINNNSIFGSGNIDISGGGSTISVDSALSATSENPVQNKVITNALNSKQDTITQDTTLKAKTLIAENLNITGKRFILQDIAFSDNGNKLTISNTRNASIVLNGVDIGTADNDAVNVSQLNEELDEKQEKFVTLDITNKKINLDPTEYNTIGVTDGSLISFGSELVLNAISNIRVTSPILMQTTNIHNDNYTITWDVTNEAIKITFHE